MEYGLIGEHLTHSFSKEIHSQFADYDYKLLELKPEELPEFFKKREFKAINVTIPYKEKVMEYLDFIEIDAREVGAVNTIVNDNGVLNGYNTDLGGMCGLIEMNKIKLKDKKVLILGTGGTSKTAENVAQALGAKEILIVSRTKKTGVITYSEAEIDHTDAQIIINTTPVGMYPNTHNMPIDIDKFNNLAGVVDAIYNPLNSELVLKAKQKGIKATGGLLMLVIQGALAVRKFLTTDISGDKIITAYQNILNSKQNLVLTGMPGCGKTTIGKDVAKLLGREFLDSDKEIEKKTGLKIPEIFQKYGENEFRRIESEVIAEISKLSGVVVATGGGAVLRKENVFNLKQNGKLIFIDRKLHHITATKGRPLSKDKKRIAELYKQRIKIYRTTADIIFNPVKSVLENSKKIVKEFSNENISD